MDLDKIFQGPLLQRIQPPSSGGTGTGAVSTVFGRSGDVIALSGDYSAAQVTNAVSTIGSYADPTWLASLGWSKLAGVPATFAPSAHNHPASDIVSGIISTDRLGSGTAGSTVFLRGDGTWAAPSQIAQSPWTANIDANQKLLTNIPEIDLALTSGATGTLKATASAIRLDSTSPTADISLNSNRQINLNAGIASATAAVYISNNLGQVAIFGYNGGVNSGFGGKNNPAYPIDSNGDCNITGVYRINGTAWNPQTPWAQNIDAASFTLSNVGNIATQPVATTENRKVSFKNSLGLDNAYVAYYGPTSANTPVSNVAAHYLLEICNDYRGGAVGEGDISFCCANTEMMRFSQNSFAVLVFTPLYADNSLIRAGSFGINDTANWLTYTVHAGGTVNGNYGVYWDKASERIQLITGSSARWNISSAGHMLAATDNAYDIGASGANRPKNVYIAGQLTIASVINGSAGITCGAGNGFIIANRSKLTSPIDGKFLLSNQAGTTFTALCFGIASSSFPSLKVNGAALDVRLGDDSAYTAISASAYYGGGVSSTAAPDSPAPSVVIGGTRPTILLDQGTTSRSRIIQYAIGHCLALTANLYSDGTNWNHDDISAAGMSLIFNANTGMLNVQRAPAGANPAAPVSKFQIDALNGYMYASCAGSAVDTPMWNNSFYAYLNEAGNTLTFRVKYSTGTIKQGTIALA